MLKEINIAFVNELSYLFNRMNIRVDDVLDAASSKCLKPLSQVSRSLKRRSILFDAYIK